MPATIVEVRGTPQIVDTFLGPIIRAGAWTVGILGGLSAWFAALYWWVPLPLALCVLGAEGWLYRRGDRAQTLKLVGTRLVLEDPLGSELSVELTHITNATLFLRPAQELAGMQTQAVDFALGDDEGVRFSGSLNIAGSIAGRIEDVQVGSIDNILGGIAGVYRALAPPACRPRQSFLDADQRLLNALLAAVPSDAWKRTGVRTWKGMEPDLDLFGYHSGAHDGWMVLDGHQWTHRQGSDVSQGTVRGWGLSRSDRGAVIFQGLEDRQTVERVSLGLVNLGIGTTLAIPMPHFSQGEEEPLTGDLLHTHAPEGAAVLWHLLLHTPPDVRPPALEAQIASMDVGPLLP